MSQSRTFNQAANQIIAGKTLKKQDESAANCIKPQEQGSLTPEHIKRFRKSYKIEPGKVILHYGIANDQRPLNIIHGSKTNESVHVDQLFQDPNGQGIKQLVNQIKEQKYASRQKEPLGQTISRNYNVPQECSKENFFYGQKTVQNEFSGKEVVFPPDSKIKETKEDRERYIKTHQLYDPGEQKSRGYNWPSQINQDHRFGKCEQLVPNQINEVLMPENNQNKFTQTVLVKKNLEDFRNFKDEPIGKPKNLGQTNKYIPEDFVYGLKPKQGDDWNASLCIRGQATLQESLADDNLGKATRYGYRNQVKEGDENKIFGVPTIRTDIKKPGFKSVADPNNYGDEPIGVQLLFPQKYSTLGLSQEDFDQLRPKEEIKDIFKAIGISYISGKFETVYKRALEIQQSTKNVSCSAFLQAVNEMHEID